MRNQQGFIAEIPAITESRNMRKQHNIQTLFYFNPIHPKTEKKVALLDDLLKELGTKILRKVEADLTYRLKNPYTGAEAR
jgi:ribosomal protein S16